MPGLRAAIRPGVDATLVAIHVSPNAKDDAFPDCYDPWRKRIGIRVRAPAQDGQANAAVVRVVAARLGIASKAVTIISGHLDVRKTIRIAAPMEHILPLLERLLAAESS